MNLRTNFRELLVGHNRVCPRDEISLEPGTVEMCTNDEMVFRKRPEDTVYVLDSDTIMAVTKPRLVFVPMVLYVGTQPEDLVVEVNDAIVNTLYAASLHEKHSEDEFPIVPAEQAIAFLSERFGPRGLSALLFNPTTEALLPKFDLPAYHTDGTDGVVFGVSAPKYVGHLVEDTSQHANIRPDDVLLMDDGTRVAWPHFTRVGVLVHGGVVGVRVKS
jgi:hypothetical protein